jgi:hypothetical protein
LNFGVVRVRGRVAGSGIALKVIVVCIRIVVDLEGIEAIPTGLLSRRFLLPLPCFLGIAITIHFLFKSYRFRESACLFGATATA